MDNRNGFERMQEALTSQEPVSRRRALRSLAAWAAKRVDDVILGIPSTQFEAMLAQDHHTAKEQDEVNLERVPRA